MKKIKIFVHLIDNVSGYEFYANRLADNLISSKLINAAEEVNFVYNYKLIPTNWKFLQEKLKDYNNVNFIQGKGIPQDFEIPTIMELKKSADSCIDECYYLYLHLKGVTHSPLADNAADDLAKMLIYCNIQKWEECVAALDHGYDVAGVNWWDAYSAWHYPGNYWWAKSSYLKTLPNLEFPHKVQFKRQLQYGGITDDWYRAEAEIWIGGSPAKAYNVARIPPGVQPGWTRFDESSYTY